MIISSNTAESVFAAKLTVVYNLDFGFASPFNAHMKYSQYSDLIFDDYLLLMVY